MRKYELIESARRGLYRIKAIINFADVEAGDIGGFVENEVNLSHEGEAWVYGNAIVSGNAHVCDHANVYGNAHVSGNAHVYDYALVSGYTNVCANAMIGETYHIFTAGPVGSRDDYVTFFRNEDKEIFVVCGCFEGTISEFLNKVNETYPVDKDTDNYGNMYRSLVEIAENKSNILR